MNGLTIILFLCICIPMIPVIVLLKDKGSRLFLIFMLIGMTICFIASELNPLLLELFGGDSLYVTPNITPIAEELLKSLAVLYFALVISDDRERLLPVSMAVGLGVAMLESLVILTGSVSSVTVIWAVMRGLGAAQIHSSCTALVGLGVGYIRKKKELFFAGTFSLLIAASIFHAIFNMLVQSEYRWLAFAWSLLLFVPLIASCLVKKKPRK